VMAIQRRQVRRRRRWRRRLFWYGGFLKDDILAFVETWD
jgi:hypothetical protein